MYVDPLATNTPTISHNEFMRMFSIGLPATQCKEDTLALLKRTSLVMFANRMVYIREASPKPIPVKVVSYPEGNKDLLTQECKEKFGKYKSGETVGALGMVACIHSQVLLGSSVGRFQDNCLEGMSIHRMGGTRARR